MKRLPNISLSVLAIVLAITALSASSLKAGVRFEMTYTSGPADIRVWLADEYTDGYDHYRAGYHEYDVYRSVDDVVLYVRASRTCYATVYVVDTEGFIHVVHPLSPRDAQFLRGGRVYAFHLADSDFGRYGFDRGVAYVYAVSSPVPFRFVDYGWGVFGGNYGYRIYGDPYLAAHEFYESLLLPSFNVSRIGVSHARFYVREYARYPRYLCVGWHDYHGVRQYCRGNCTAYRHYHRHVKDPYVVLRPDFKIKHASSGSYTRIRRSADVRFKEKNSVLRRTASKSSVLKTTSKHAVDVDRKSSQVSRVVKSSKSSVIRGKADLSLMRDRLEKRSAKSRSVVTKVDSKRSTKKTTVKRVKSDKSRNVKKDSDTARKSHAKAPSKSKKKAKRDAH
ncbi:MAG: hypothetical protein O7D32_07590 [bacterium]|nr:hypothetical protein [bacterium]